VRVYRARIEPEAAPAQVIEEKKLAGKGLSRAALAIIAIVVIAGAVILYQFALRPSPSKTEIASKGKMALPLPDKPSLIVLPFVNMSEDPKQEFFADGLTEEIINALSRLPNVFVIARNSSFAYKGKAVDVKQLGREMGVQYVLEGSVRREGNRIRITAQLIDSPTNRHVFSERYDREVKEIFATQDDIAIKVLTALRVAMKDEDFVLFQAKGVSNVEAYFKLLEARKHNEKGNKENNDRARRLAEEALLLDPGSSAAYARLAHADYIDLWVNPLVSREETIAHGMAMARKAIALDDNPYGHGTLALMYVQKRDYDKAVEEGERAASMDPALLHTYGTTLHHACRPTEAIPVFQKVLRLNPVKPSSNTLMVLANCYMNAGKYEEALLTSKRLLQENPDHFLGTLVLTRIYFMMGRMTEARAQLAVVLRINPKFSLENYEKIIRYKDPDYTKRATDAYRELGLK
jgi:adenylate cyclase